MVKTLRRYTNLAAAINILESKKITLLNPETWDDRNDVYFMSEYKTRKNLKTLLALCFAERLETYHHWRIFAGGSDGVCISIDKEKFLSGIEEDKKIQHGPVSYKKMKDVRQAKTIEIDELPFLQRHAYGDELEYRIIYADASKEYHFKQYDFDITCIRRITISPWLNRVLFETVKKTLKSIDGCSKLDIYHSRLIDNETWKKFSSRANT